MFLDERPVWLALEMHCQHTHAASTAVLFIYGGACEGMALNCVQELQYDDTSTYVWMRGISGRASGKLGERVRLAFCAACWWSIDKTTGEHEN